MFSATLHNDAVTTDKIADKNITRAKLADDALYSPVVEVTANRDFAVTDLGRTLKNSGANRTLTISTA